MLWVFVFVGCFACHFNIFHVINAKHQNIFAKSIDARNITMKEQLNLI